MGKTLGSLELKVLGAILKLGDQAYGIAIQNWLAEHKDKVSLPAIYTTLDRMQKKGFVKSRLGEPTAERGGRAKTFFAVTALGRGALIESARSLNLFLPEFAT